MAPLQALRLARGQEPVAGAEAVRAGYRSAGDGLEGHEPGCQHPDAARVAALLGRTPRGGYEVVVRDASAAPVVIRNAPLLFDGTPMPTRYWLVGARARRAVDRLEAAGGVRAAAAAVPAAAIADAHARYQQERDTAIPPEWRGARPSGGVGGTRRGVKCLHAHFAWYLAGGDDPVGAWVAAALRQGQAGGLGPGA